MKDAYQTFLARKRIVDAPTGISGEVSLPAALFPFQRDCVRWALRRGRAALFEDCGLGKSAQQLAWASVVENHTRKPVLILAPLGVDKQTESEAAKFGIEARVVASQSEISERGIYITNYEKLHRFDCSKFDGVAIDESSILKAYDGKTRTLIIESFRKTPFRLACTATPSPNDFMELGNHAEFLGVMSRSEMLATFFVHDGGDTSKWRLKGHAQEVFWLWVCSWAVNIRKPSDLGYPDDGFILPAITYREHVVETSALSAGMLFAMPASSLQERRAARRSSLDQRVTKAAELARQSGGKALIWCNLNDEQNDVARLLGSDCVSIQGSTPPEDRILMERAWREGSTRFLVTKAALFGWGMNWQHCDTAIYCGLSDSWEEFYQTVRRIYRFGQRSLVTIHVVVSNLEDAVLSNIKRKQADADRMADEMVRHMAEISSAEIKGTERDLTTYNPNKRMLIPTWLEEAA